MHISLLTRPRYLIVIGCSVAASLVVIVIAAGLARATLNLKAALTDKPDIGLYLLLPEEEITTSEFLREAEDGKERDYLAQTKDGPKLVKLKKGEKEWYVSVVEKLHE